MFIHVKSHKTEPVSADTLNLHECVEYLESFFFAWDPRWNRYDQKTVTFKSKINEIKIYAEKRSLADDLWLWDFCHKNVPLWTISDYEIFHELSLFQLFRNQIPYFRSVFDDHYDLQKRRGCKNQDTGALHCSPRRRWSSLWRNPARNSIDQQVG